MKNTFLLLTVFTLIFSSCKREEDEDHHHHDTTDTSAPVISLNTPADSSVYQNGDTVFISGMVTDEEMHAGTIIIKDDTTLTEYFNQSHYVHDLTSAQINYIYIVNGITQNRAATLTVRYEDHAPNVGIATRRLIFIP